MKNYNFELQKYHGSASRYNCPSCGKKTFTRYIDKETGKMIDASVGRCDRQDKCGYHYTPGEYFRKTNFSVDALIPKPPVPIRIPKPPISYLPFDVLKSSLGNYHCNYFISFLISLFGKEITEKLTAKYFIGTSSHWLNSTVFWQIDLQGRIRTGKIILYDPVTGRRVKEPINHVGWLHNDLKIPDFELSQCLFGEHLLKDTSKPVAIVESEKTAIIASRYLPQLIWLATGGKENLNEKKCAVLKGRNVILFPDLKAFDKWSNKSKELSLTMPDTRFTVSDLLEKAANEEEKDEGLDIADYLVKFNWREFRSRVEPF